MTLRDRAETGLSTTQPTGTKVETELKDGVGDTQDSRRDVVATITT
ncbi:MAG: hypothetical protein ACR2NZ_16450 [Rubripirellula sp.]